jgi:outer membrane protein OmpA-like peptidoglycan-associated protein
MSVSTGLGFNFRTSDRFSIQLEAGRKWKVDNSFDYNQANLRGMYALGSCGSASASSAVASTKVADSDGDGVADNVDECPYVAGKPEFFGCPDSDGDGLGDSKDKCPFDKGSAANQGCPDAATTPNTVAPSTPAETTTTKQNKLVQSFEIFFANGTTFAPNQVETLQKVATMLKNNPNYTVVINGNAYKGGSKALSLQRAEKVANTLRMKGVNVSNAKTAGFGDTRAKYNNTKDNRAEIEVYSFE